MSEEESSGMEAESSVPSEPEPVVFPPPAQWYRTCVIAARDDMWAYLTSQQIVLVRPKQTFTKKPEVEVVAGGGGGGPETPTTVSKEDTSTSSSSSLWPSFQLFGHLKEGYGCLSFCQNAWEFLPVKNSPLVTGCRDGAVKIWNTTTGECVMYHDAHKDGNGKSIPVAAIDWSVRNPKAIYSVDEEGTLVSWYLPKAQLKSFSFGKIAPSSLHCSPHEDHYLCLGSKGGNIYIVRAEATGKASACIVHKVRHDEEVVSTLWCPKLDWRLSKNENNVMTGAMFASTIQSAKSPTVRLWGRNAEDRGIYQIGEKDRSTYGKVYRNFSPLLWAIDPNSGEPMLITARKGDVVAFLKDSSIAVPVHNIHNHLNIFGLVQCGDILWSTSYEPLIVGYNLRSMSVHCVIPTFKGICSIAPSPNIGTLIGIGGVDGCIRAMDLVKDYPMKVPIKEPYVSYRLRSKILSVAWHPRKDNWLGFGTDDGVIGIFELHENQKQVKQFERHVKGAVYAVDWGPQVSHKNKSFDDKDSSIVLYACGGSKIFSVHPGSTKNPLVEVLPIINSTNPQSSRKCGIFGDSDSDGDSPPVILVSKAADIRWAPDFSLMAVGYNDGRVELYSPPFLQLKCWIKCHARAIQYISWRPYDFLPQVQGKDRWLATSSNDGTCKLFNLGDIFQKEFLSDETLEAKLIISSAATLRTPNGDRLICSAWNPHDPNLICTVSYDSTGIVWNVKEGTPIARYFGHGHRLVACAFHPANKYLIVTASDEIMHDFTLHMWDYRDYPFAERAPQHGCKKGKASPLYIKNKVEQTLQEEADGDKDLQSAQSSQKDLSSHLHVVDPAAVEALKQNKWRVGSKSLLPSTANVFINSKLNLEDEVKYIVEHLVEKKKLEDTTNNTNDGKQVNGNGQKSEKTEEDDDKGGSKADSRGKLMIYLGLLGDYGDCVELLKLECESFGKKGDWEKCALLASWVDDEEYIEKAVDSGKISETILNLSRGRDKGSNALYKKACILMAEKLMVDDEYCKAATYLLHASLREQAIQVLVDNKLYRDAVALMKLSMPKKSPIHLEVMKKWLVRVTQDGNFETACKIYASLKMYEDALAVIEKRDTSYAWRTGIYLAWKAGNGKKMELLALKLCIESMGKFDYEPVKRIMAKYQDELKWLLPLILIHESIFHLSNKLRDQAMNQNADSFPKGEFKKNLMNTVGWDTLRDDGILQKLKETVVITVAQNRSDAEVILIRSLALAILGDLDVKSAEGECEKLCATWLKEKDLFMYNAYVMAFNDVN